MTTNAATSAPPTDTDLLACGRAIARFYALLDGLQSGPVGQMMASDGIWHRQGAVLKGPAEVDQALGQRPAGRTSLHLISNMQMEAAADAQIRARYLLQVYRHDRAADAPAQPAPLPDGLLAVTWNEDVWQDVAGGWKLAHKESKVLFLRSAT